MPSLGSTNDDRVEPWRNMSIEELEKEYSPSKWSERYSAEEIIGAHIKSASEASEASRKLVPNRLNVSYGSGPKMLLDIFGANLPRESVLFVYVHGGYWQQLNKELSEYVVQPLYKNGIVVVVVEYDLAPKVTVETIVSQVREAVSWTCNFAQTRGSKGVVLCGHSAGGQLITQVLSTAAEGTTAGADLTKYKNIIKGAIPLSGVFDLRPLVKTYVNEPLKLIESSAWSLSPIGRISEMARDWPGVRLLVAVGDHDSPEFQRQSEEYCQGCVKAGLQAEYMLVDSVDHFNIVEDLAQEKFSLTQKIIEFVKNFNTQNQ